MTTKDYKSKKIENGGKRKVNARGNQWFFRGFLRRGVSLENFQDALNQLINNNDLRNYAVGKIEEDKDTIGEPILIQGQLQWKMGCPKSRKTIEDLLTSKSSNVSLREEKVSWLRRKNLILHLNGSKRTLKRASLEEIPTACDNFDYIVSLSDKIYHSKKLVCQGGISSYINEDSSDDDISK